MSGTKSRGTVPSAERTARKMLFPAALYACYENLKGAVNGVVVRVFKWMSRLPRLPFKKIKINHEGHEEQEANCLNLRLLA